MTMRQVVILLALSATAAADARRECPLQDPALAIKDLGCFDDLRHTEDHTSGTRVCLVRSPTGVCSGVLWLWEGPPEGTPILLDEATCGGKTGKVELSTSHDEGGLLHLIAFSGRIVKRTMRGAYAYGKTKKVVTWKLAKNGFDAAERIRTLTAEACKPQP